MEQASPARIPNTTDYFDCSSQKHPEHWVTGQGGTVIVPMEEAGGAWEMPRAWTFPWGKAELCCALASE